MTLHQLTHATAFEIDFGAVTALRRLLVRAATLPRAWGTQRRLDQELAKLDHRERADLSFRS